MFEPYRPNLLALNYQVVFFLRRYSMLLTLTLLPTFSLSQIIVQMFSTMVIISYLWRLSPYKSNLANFMETVNEVTVLVAAYPLLSFTDWMDFNDKDSFGWYIVTCICLNVVLNITVVLFIFVRQLYLRCKFYFIRKRKVVEAKLRIQMI